MADRQILFSAPMIRALLSGTKMQTRRVVKARADRDMGPRCVLQPHELAGEVNGGNHRNAYCEPGDRLWVRETWAYGTHALAAERDEDGPFVYAADGTTQGRLCDRWRPSIHMPRWASRITLEVTEVRVERLLDISEADAEAEGIAYSERYQGWCIGQAEHFNSQDPRQSYFSLWESINGAGSVEANPWVWCVSFKRLEVTNG